MAEKGLQQISGNRQRASEQHCHTHPGQPDLCQNIPLRLAPASQQDLHDLFGRNGYASERSAKQSANDNRRRERSKYRRVSPSMKLSLCPVFRHSSDFALL